jgi:F-type H+-transporting ATPase subunit gamma
VVAALNATSEGDVEGKPGIDELWLIYTKFVNSVSQTPQSVRISPVGDVGDQPDGKEQSGDRSGDRAGDGSGEPREARESGDSDDGASYEFEPEPAALIGALLPKYVSSRIFSALLESAASESASRRQAMKSATDNASELIRTYTRLASQARQAEITQEISEIVGGADALAASGDDE